VVYHDYDAEKIEEDDGKGHQHGRNLCPRVAKKIYRHRQGVNDVVRAEGAYYQNTAFFPVGDGEGKDDPEKDHHEKNTQGAGPKQPRVEFRPEVYGHGTVEKMKGQKIPETKPVEKADVLLADMPSESYKPSQRNGKKHEKDGVEAEKEDAHLIPCCNFSTNQHPCLVPKGSLPKGGFFDIMSPGTMKIL
jgi:hypothetical protein